MTTRKTGTHIDPVQVMAIALKHAKTVGDYYRLRMSEPERFELAWDQLPESEQQRLTDIVNNVVEPTPQVIANELSACGSLVQFQATKSSYGATAIKAAWKLLTQDDRDRLTAVCKNQDIDKDGTPNMTDEEPEPVTEAPTIYKVESETKLTKRNLIELSSNLQQLDSLLDTIDGDIPADLQLAVDELLAQREATNDAVLDKLDNYCGLIQSRLMWIAARRAESDRLAKLAESDTKVVDFLRSRLKSHLEATDQKKLRTKRFNISVCANGGKAPLRFDGTTTPDQMPEHFQRATVEPNREAIRAALEQGEELQFAYLGEREHHLRIK